MSKVWNVHEVRKMQRRLQGHESPIIAVAFSPDGRVAPTASGSLWNHKEQTVHLLGSNVGQRVPWPTERIVRPSGVRVEKLLAKGDDAAYLPEERAVEALEHIATAEARELLRVRIGSPV